MTTAFEEQNLRGTVIALLLLAGSTALGAGYSFMADPSGSAVGIPLWYISQSGFTSYFIPGLILFVAIGVFGIATSLTVIFRWQNYPMALLLYGMVLTGWIAVQIVLVRDFNLLHLLCIVIGLALVYSSSILKSVLKVR